jgi:hypothetical protein
MTYSPRMDESGGSTSKCNHAQLVGAAPQQQRVVQRVGLCLAMVPSHVRHAVQYGHPSRVGQ